VAALLTLSQSVAAVGQQGIDSRAAFERLKGLVGTWNATLQGKPGFADVTTFKMAGGGRVLVQDDGETLSNAFHLDVDKLMVTHYCGSGNQPRMRVKEIDDRRIAFEMFDITNLTNPQGYRTTHLDIVFVSPDRIDIAYRGTSETGETTQVFQLTRKKA
jgi:hypothetical protein